MNPSSRMNSPLCLLALQFASGVIIEMLSKISNHDFLLLFNKGEVET